MEYLLRRPIIPEELNKLSDQKESLYRNLCLKNADVFQLSPGTSDVLDFLYHHHIPHTIATASNGDNLDFFFKHLKLDQWFDRSKVVYDSGVFSGKQGMFSKAAQNLNLLPKDCIVIEDSKSGIIAAHNARIGKIIALGPQEDHDLLKSVKGVSEVITSMQQLEMEKILILH